MQGQKVTRKELRGFARSIGIFFALWTAILFFKTYHFFVWMAAVSALFFVSMIFVPAALLAPLHRVLSAIGRLIGSVATSLLMLFLFYFIFTPIGLIVRLTGHGLLGHGKERSTYWLDLQDDGADRTSYERQF